MKCIKIPYNYPIIPNGNSDKSIDLVVWYTVTPFSKRPAVNNIELVCDGKEIQWNSLTPQEKQIVSDDADTFVSLHLRDGWIPQKVINFGFIN